MQLPISDIEMLYNKLIFWSQSCANPTPKYRPKILNMDFVA